MALNDLMTEIRQDPANYSGDEAIELKVLNHVMNLVEDKISEVKNQAVKWSVPHSRLRVLMLDQPWPTDQDRPREPHGVRHRQAH